MLSKAKSVALDLRMLSVPKLRDNDITEEVGCMAKILGNKT
jgi:hypothetical protein